MPVAFYGSILVSTIFSPVLSAGVFEGRSVNVKWEVWDDSSPLQGGSLVGQLDEENVVASDEVNPDIKDFHDARNSFELWDIDLTGETITLTYTSRYVGDFDHQYMYVKPVGFHFEDVEDNLPDIVNVTVDENYAPFGFRKELVSFDANNVYVDLNGSMCHIDGMASMPDCFNADSPTKYDNLIKLNIEFDGQTGSNFDFEKLDQFYNWVELSYPQYFPTNSTSAMVIGYYARYYPQTDVYIGSRDGKLFVYGNVFGGLLDLGDIEQWYSQAGI